MMVRFCKLCRFNSKLLRHYTGVFFGALCITAGPSGKFGDVSFLTKYLKCSAKRA